MDPWQAVEKSLARRRGAKRRRGGVQPAKAGGTDRASDSGRHPVGKAPRIRPDEGVPRLFEDGFPCGALYPPAVGDAVSVVRHERPTPRPGGPSRSDSPTGPSRMRDEPLAVRAVHRLPVERLPPVHARSYRARRISEPGSAGIGTASSKPVELPVPTHRRRHPATDCPAPRRRRSRASAPRSVAAPRAGSSGGACRSLGDRALAPTHRELANRGSRSSRRTGPGNALIRWRGCARR